MLPPTASLAQTYTLAAKVKAKLTREAVKSDVDLHRLVCQANLLDTLIGDLNALENASASASASGFSYDTIGASAYPLLDVVSLAAFNAASAIDADANADVYTENFTDSESETESDSDSDSDSNSDVEIVSEHIVDYYADSGPANQYLVAHEKLTQGLHNLNLQSTLTEDDYIVSKTTISYNDGESDSDSDSESDPDSYTYDTDDEQESDESSHFDTNHASLREDFYSLKRSHSANLTLNDSEHSELPPLSNCSSLSSMDDLVSVSLSNSNSNSHPLGSFVKLSHNPSSPPPLVW